MNIKKLESWYQKNHIKFPFRQTKDPYKIWVSEIMLQQTQLETVLPYYERFLNQFPDVFSLSKATDDSIKKCVEGIGYYRRFMLMKKAASVIVNDFNGTFPNHYKDVLSLPGIGLYTAGAIMSIAFEQPYGAVDGNVIRILSRQYLVESDMRLEKNKHTIRDLNQHLIEQSNPSDYTQALMDLGRTVCKPKNPLCESCPIAETCQAYDRGIVHQLPHITKLNQAKEMAYIVLVIHAKDGIVLRKRTETLLEGMYEYPQFESDSIQHVINELDEQGIMMDVLDGPIMKKHVFTHQKWFMQVYHCRLVGQHIKADWKIYTTKDMATLPMATAHKKIRG